jgi:ATP-dependent Clp protease ATP-binding subunit ClpA
MDKSGIEIMLKRMRKNNHESNIKIIKKTFFGDLNYKNIDGENILLILTDEKYNEEECLIAIKSLLKEGFDPNFTDSFGYNFIQYTLYAGYSESFILEILKTSIALGLDVNHVDCDGDSMLHTAIYSDDYSGAIESLYKTLKANGYNDAIKDKKGNDLIDAMLEMQDSLGKYTTFQIDSLRRLLSSYKAPIARQHNEQPNNTSVVTKNTTSGKEELADPVPESKVEPVHVEIPEPQLSSQEIKELEEFGKVLNIEPYLSRPTIGRDDELTNLILVLAQEKKNPLIVGEPGVGKTVLVEDLVYNIQNNSVPNFLKNQIILEVSPSELVAGTKYVGTFEERLKKMMNVCQKYNVILFIDEIHTIFGVGTTENKSSDLSDIIKYYIDRTNIKLIGTTTNDEYQEFFSSSALKRRFEKIIVEEPNEKTMKLILEKTIRDYCNKNNITFQQPDLLLEVCNILLSVTDKKHRVHDDKINNPDLSIAIIDKAFAYAKIKNSEYIEPTHFAQSINLCNRIYESARQDAIHQLNDLGPASSRDKILPFKKK